MHGESFFGIGGIAGTFRFIFYNPESYCHSILQISKKKTCISASLSGGA